MTSNILAYQQLSYLAGKIDDIFLRADYPKWTNLPYGVQLGLPLPTSDETDTGVLLNSLQCIRDRLQQMQQLSTDVKQFTEIEYTALFEALDIFATCVQEGRYSDLPSFDGLLPTNKL